VKGRLFTFFTVVSLLLWLAVCMLWVRSSWRGDRVDVLVYPSAYRQTPAWAFALLSGKGGLGFSAAHSCTNYADEASWRRAVEQRPARRISHDLFPAVYPRWSTGDWGWGRAGFQWVRRDSTAPTYWSTQRSVVVPYWLPSLFAAIAPALWIRARLVKVGRKRHGLCLGCGYDLTGNASGTCPECGTLVRRPKAVS
jgi:hypothetical protein